VKRNGWLDDLSTARFPSKENKRDAYPQERERANEWQRA
jgi:hypothetical protein